MTALFGPSGCGKTTVLRCIAGLHRLADGVCEIDGDTWQDRDGTFLPTHKRPLGYVFQEASLFPHLTVRKNLLFGAPPGATLAAATWKSASDRVRRGHRSPRRDAAARPIAAQSLRRRTPAGGDRAGAPVATQAPADGRAPVRARPRHQGEILPFLERLRDRLSLPIVYITHDLAEVERLADQVVLMEKGGVLAAGPLADLQSDPSLPLATARDAAVTLDATVEAYDARLWPADARCPRRPLHRARVARARAASIGASGSSPATSVSRASRPGRARSSTSRPGGSCSARRSIRARCVAVVALGARRGRPALVASHSEVLGVAEPRRRRHSLRAGQGRGPRAGARRLKGARVSRAIRAEGRRPPRAAYASILTGTDFDAGVFDFWSWLQSGISDSAPGNSRRGIRPAARTG